MMKRKLYETIQIFKGSIINANKDSEIDRKTLIGVVNGYCKTVGGALWLAHMSDVITIKEYYALQNNFEMFARKVVSYEYLYC